MSDVQNNGTEETATLETPSTAAVSTVNPSTTEQVSVIPSDPTVSFATAEERGNQAAGLVEATLTDPKQFIEKVDATQKYTTHEQGILETIRKEMPDATEASVQQEFTTRKEDEVVKGEDSKVEAVGALVASQGEVAGDVLVKDYDASLMDTDEITKSFSEIQKATPFQAASMEEKLNGLLTGMEDGKVPQWAQPAVTKVEQQLAARGLSASSVGRDSLFNAIINAAMPIAKQDADYEQQARASTYTAQVQALMSDASVSNAALQFNATSENQRNQFVSQLTAQVEGQNAARQDAMSQFNTSAQNSINQFNNQLETQRRQFNAQMSAQIEQSNVQWRRQVNTQNTAGINAVNQANAQNAFNLTNQSMAFLWQELRDEAHWAQQADQSALDRKNRLEAAMLANETAMGKEFGSQFSNIVNGLTKLGDWVDGR